MRNWQLQQAKAQLSSLVREAMTHGPQEISLRGEPAVIVISKKEYNKLLQQEVSLVTFIRDSPLKNTSIQIDRDSSSTRDITL